MTSRLLVIGTAIMTTLLAVVALWQFRLVVIYVLISLVLAAAFRPNIQGESRNSFAARSLLILTYLAGAAASVFLIFIVGKLLIGDFQQLAERLSIQSTWKLPAWLAGGFLQQALLAWTPTPDKLFEALTSQRQFVVPAALSFTEGIGGLLSGFFIILFLSVYWSTNQNHFERLWLSLLPAEQRKQARTIWRTIDHDLGAYTRSEIIQSILAVVLLGLGYWILGSPYPTLLAVTGAIAWLVPVVGAGIALILPLLLGLLNGPQLSLLTAVYTLVILIALQLWVEPRLFKLSWESPILTFIILLAMADAFGLLGIIVAPLLAVICQILWKLLINDRLGPTTADQVADLIERQARLQVALDEMEGPPPPEVISSMKRLNELLEKAEPILHINPEAKPHEFFHLSQPVDTKVEKPTSTKS